MSVTQRFRGIWEKNGPEIRMILARRTPPFLRNRPVKTLGANVPVFVFHSVEPERFESQLRYLADNGYSAITCDELDQSFTAPLGSGHRRVALTFDDATGSFWAVAYPLLRKYGLKGILFVIAGLVPNDDTDWPNLEDVWARNASLDEVRARESHRPLCTWKELLAMHQSGVVDIQSHSLTHAKIPVSDEVIDFVSPEFDPWFFGNVNLPVCARDRVEAPERMIRLGAPVYRSVPRLAGAAGCFADDRVAQELVSYVEKRGGGRFFQARDWRPQLEARVTTASAKLCSRPRRESAQESEGWMRRELAMSKQILEEKIPGLRVRHFCYPWFRGCEAADLLARECGYSAVHYGFELPPATNMNKARPIRIVRYSEEYLYSLPGKGRRWPYTVWLLRMRALAGRKV